ncbi:MAG: Lrp/AsnC family transcriptional regulator [Methylocystaceae bacterium]
MDIINRELLKLLERNARLNLSNLAALLQTTEEDVHQRITTLEEERIINGYSAIIDWEQVENPWVRALIEVKVNPEPEVGFDHIARIIADHSEVVDVILVSGTYDLLVTVEGIDMGQIAGFVAQKLAALETVQSATTHFVMRNYKKDGFICGKQEFDHRLVIQL